MREVRTTVNRSAYFFTVVNNMFPKTLKVVLCQKSIHSTRFKASYSLYFYDF